MFPLAWPSLILWGFSLGNGPRTSQWWYFKETCLHLTEQNKLSGAWSKKKKERESFKRRKKKRKKQFLQNFSKISLWISVVFMLRENFISSNCAKNLDPFVKTLHHQTSVRRALLLLALIVCKNRILPFILFYET